MLSRLAQLSRDSLIYGLGGAAVRYTGLILLPIYTRAFSSAEYGVLESINNLGALLLAVAMLGLDGAVPLLYFATEDATERKRIASLWVWLTVAAAVPVTGALIAGAEWVSAAASGSPANADLFRLGVAVLPFTLLQSVFSHIMRLTFRPALYALLNFSLTTLIALASIVLVVFFNMGLRGALWGVFVGTAAVTLVSAFALRGTVGAAGIRAGAGAPVRRMLRLGAPLLPAAVALWIISFSNTYFLIQLAGPDATGVFRVGARLAALLGMGVWAFQLAWGPYSLSVARQPDAPRLFSKVATLFTAGAVGASVVLAGLAPVLLRVFATRSYLAASSVIGVLALASAALGAYYVVALGVNLAHRTGTIAFTTIIAAGVNLALNALLIPAWGIVGAGLAALAANLTSAGLIFAMSQRYYPLPFETLKLLAVWLVGSLLVAGAAVFNASAQPSPAVSAGFALFLTLLYAAFLFGASVITVRELRLARSAIAGTLARRLQ